MKRDALKRRALQEKWCQAGTNELRSKIKAKNEDENWTKFSAHQLSRFYSSEDSIYDQL